MNPDTDNNSAHKKQKQIALLTFGCQMNKSDSELISGLLVGKQYRLTKDLSEADVILLNTCSIREKAEQKVYSQIGRLAPLKKRKPDLIIGVGGCVGQLEGEKILNRSPLVNLVFGTSNIQRLPKLLEQIEKTGSRIVEVNYNQAWDDPVPEYQRESKITAWVSIIRGCNNFCSYCVVPYARGREISRNANEIIEEISLLAKNGCKEVTLLGQNVNSYGRNRSGGKKFPELLKMVNDVDGIERIRFVTSHPKDFSDPLVQAIAELDKVCETIHLPIQSGSDAVLDRMNRGYGAEQYIEKLKNAKSKINNLTVTTDIIIGFPGETEDDFEQTRTIVEEVEYDSMFLFKYSKRPETTAASFENQIPEKTKQRRFEEILKIQNSISLKKNKSYEGKNEEVLVEGRSKNDKNKMTGRTRNNKIVNFSGGDDSLLSHLIQVRISKGRLYGLEGIYER